MRARLLGLAALLCALPARGDQAALDTALAPAALDALTMIDALPTRAQIDFAIGTTGAATLLALARDATADLGLQIRAIRLLPVYCPAGSCAGTAVHAALADLVSGYVSRMTRSPDPLSPADILRLRAAMEALGATRSGLDSDVALFTATPQLLLHHPSRDVQATAVRALRGVCSPDLCSRDMCTAGSDAVRALLGTAPSPLLQSAVISALQGLAPCSDH